MRGGVTSQAFKTQRDLHQIFKLFVAIDGGFELRRFFECGLEFNAQRGWYQFGEPVDFTVRNIHGAANIFDGGFSGHGAEGDDLRNIFAAVFMGDVVDQFAATAHAEVDVDIRHGDAFRIQKALEQQVVLQWIDVGNTQCVADQTASSGTAPGANRNFLSTSVMNEVPDDQEVAFIVHLLDHFDFGAESAFVFCKRITE